MWTVWFCCIFLHQIPNLESWRYNACERVSFHPEAAEMRKAAETIALPRLLVIRSKKARKGGQKTAPLLIARVGTVAIYHAPSDRHYCRRRAQL